MAGTSDTTNAPRPLEVSALRRRCDAGLFEFATTAEIEDVDGAVGQSRALTALELGARMHGDGYNLYVLGPSGSHRHRLVEDFLTREAARNPVPGDWCYVNNFAENRKPVAVSLPPGRGVELRDDMARLVEELSDAIPAVFESEHYRNRVAEINQEFEDRHKGALEELQQRAKERNMALVQTPHGFAIAPTRDGKLLGDEDFEALPDDEKERASAALEEMTEQLRRHLQRLPEWQKEHREQIRELSRELTELASGRLIDQLAETYRDHDALARYFDAVREDVLKNAQDFLKTREREPEARSPGLTPESSLSRYRINVVVDHAGESRAPVVDEYNPSVSNLLGQIEHSAQFGALVTDFTMIRPGALHKANGGYLILDAHRVLTEPYAWAALKRTLQARKIRIESLGQMASLVSTVSLEPDPIPLNVKVILIGERLIYYLLCEHDPEFADLFKVAADFEDIVDRTDENTTLYARLIATLARRAELRPLSRHAVARVVEHCSRLAGDAGKLTTRLRDVVDLLRESDYAAARAGAGTLEPEHVDAAIAAQIERVDRVRDLTHEQIRRDNVLIDTDGAVVGQINGLAVLRLGNFSFGRPSRITATARIGEGSIVDIERESELGGPIHSKAVLIVASFLASRYAAKVPLSLSASVVFEQSYGGVEGDSASVAETCALLSALSGVPIRQSFAVTGSINQHGRVQVIGGVNEKIEGFFAVCRERGLSGEHGVLIPAENAKHLMLDADVVEAVAAGRFCVFPITHIDEAVEILTGMPAGRPDDDGRYPDGTVNGLVERRLRELASLRRAFGKSKRRGKGRKRDAAKGARPEGGAP